MDIDIDFADRDKVLKLFRHTGASLGVQKHKTGVYFHRVPYDSFSNLCLDDHKVAEKKGYFKLDFLNVGIYKDVKDDDHLEKLMNTEPLWELLEHEEFVKGIFQIGSHTELLKKLKPTSVIQLAAILSIIRPAKKHLSTSSWEDIMKDVWIKPKDKSAYYFKKSHAVSYAIAVIVHINLTIDKLNQIS